MKPSLLRVLLLTIFLITTYTVEAAPNIISGWGGRVEALGNGSNHGTDVSGITKDKCEEQLQLAIATYLSLGYTITRVRKCTPFFLMPKFVELDWTRVKLPPDPVCLSCPLLTPDVVNKIFQHRADQVKDLMQVYDLRGFNRELKQLKARYDLKTFEKKLFEIELELQRDQAQ